MTNSGVNKIFLFGIFGSKINFNIFIFNKIGIKIKKNFENAKKIYDKITPIIKLVGKHFYVAATKYMLNLMGFDVGKPLLPRLDLSESKKRECRKVFKELNFKKNN